MRDQRDLLPVIRNMCHGPDQCFHDRVTLAADANMASQIVTLQGGKRRFKHLKPDATARGRRPSPVQACRRTAVVREVNRLGLSPSLCALREGSARDSV